MSIFGIKPKSALALLGLAAAIALPLLVVTSASALICVPNDYADCNGNENEGGGGTDTAAPIVTIGTKPNNPSSSTTANFTVSTNEAAYLYCQFGGIETFCDSSMLSVYAEASYSGLEAGSHTFGVRAVDPSGNQGTASYSWEIDLSVVAPDVSTLGFGTHYVNTLSDPQRVTLSNSGSTFVPLETRTIADSAGDNDDDEFYIDQNTCSASLGPDSSCYIDVVFAPTSTGEKDAYLTLEVGEETYVVDLLGSAVNQSSTGGGSGSDSGSGSGSGSDSGTDSGQGGGTTSGQGSDTTAPIVSDFRAKKRSLRRAALRKLRRKIALNYSLNEAATAEIKITDRRGKTVAKGSYSATEGKNSVSLRIKKLLKAGRYVATLTAKDAAGNTASPVKTAFRIKR